MTQIGASGKALTGIKKETEIFGTIYLPPDYFKDRAKYYAADEIKKLHLAQLFIAGTADQHAPKPEVEQIFQAANQPKEYVEYPTDHFYKYDPAMLTKINDTTVAFFRQALDMQ
jgi:alpha/beta superfamily hydrolase